VKSIIWLIWIKKYWFIW